VGINMMNANRSWKNVLLALLVFICLVILPGCNDIDPAKGYTTKGLYRTDVKTVHVEVFENKSF
jgi:hypothetical protein